MFDANEIGLDWKGVLQDLSMIPYAKTAFATIDGRLKDHTGSTTRCHILIEETIIDTSMGKLVWAKRCVKASEASKDVLVKQPISQKHAKQEAVIQWLVQKTLQTKNLGDHCPSVIDVFTKSNNIWFSMTPIYSAPIFETYMNSLPEWNKKDRTNGLALLKIISQVAMCCFVLENQIGFNHRDLKPNNILIKTDQVSPHILEWKDSKNHINICVAPSPKAVIVDFGFSCLGPRGQAWIQSGDGILTPLDSCPKMGRDIFMLLVFLIWREDVRNSLIDSHLEFFKSSLHLTKERWFQMMNLNRDPSNWIYMLITERGFQCPALDPWVWLELCASKFPEVVSIETRSSSSS